MKDVIYLRNRHGLAQHEVISHLALAARLAALQGFPFLGERATVEPGAQAYLVPSDTVATPDAARQFGISTEDAFFGGVVAHPFVATKAITHPLIERDAAAPFGWSHDFRAHVAGAVLSGHAAFTLSDAARAGRRVLERGGSARIKHVKGIGGRGQAVAANAAGLDAALGAVTEAELADAGVVIEENLVHVSTISVGEARVGDAVIAYWGTQRLTRDNMGAAVYGGSTLRVTRGGFDALFADETPAHARIAIEQARCYDAAIGRCYPASFASRRNYDVAQGFDVGGRWRSGVLEQSWRIGGATGAEIAALEAFQADPDLKVVTASTVEVYGSDQAPPAGAIVYYRDVDPELGPMLKYATLDER